MIVAAAAADGASSAAERNQQRPDASTPTADPVQGHLQARTVACINQRPLTCPIHQNFGHGHVVGQGFRRLRAVITAYAGSATQPDPMSGACRGLEVIGKRCVMGLS
jgi:hypothetical protein